jgi:hypothetical protein
MVRVAYAHLLTPTSADVGECCAYDTFLDHRSGMTDNVVPANVVAEVSPEIRSQEIAATRRIRTQKDKAKLRA